jgi:hypothetical protein
VRAQIIWAKDRFALSRGHYHWQHEPCWYAVRGAASWTGDRKQSTLWSINAREDTGHGHGTQKPVRPHIIMPHPCRSFDEWPSAVGSCSVHGIAAPLVLRQKHFDSSPGIKLKGLGSQQVRFSRVSASFSVRAALSEFIQLQAWEVTWLPNR